ncbi:MAG: peroxiredoxin [Verrucomicrobiales bacterium]|jgi:peroxiredoxin
MSTRILLVIGLLIAPARADFPSLRQQFRDLPCLAPVIAKIDPNAPASLEEALSLPPNQAPVLLAPEDYGRVHFPITSTLEDITVLQRWFNQGIGLYHAGENMEAERCFRQVVTLDPSCPLAYWGLALVNERFARRAEIYLERAMHFAGQVRLSKRESQWLRAYVRCYDPAGTPFSRMDLATQEARRRGLEHSLEDLAFTFSEDVECQAFLLRALTLRLAIREEAPEQMFGLALIGEKIRAAKPNHPAMAYEAALWTAHRPANAQEAATRIVESALPIPALWSYASRAYLSNHQFHLSLAASEVGLRMIHAQSAERHESPFAAEGYGLAVWQHIDTLSTIGRMNDALTWIDMAERFPRLPVAARVPHLEDPKVSLFATRLAEARFRILVRSERWETLAMWGEKWFGDDQHAECLLGCVALRLAKHRLGQPADDLPTAEAVIHKLGQRGVVGSMLTARAGRLMEQLIRKQAPVTMKTEDLGLFPQEFAARLLFEGDRSDEGLAMLEEAVIANFNAPHVTAHAIDLYQTHGQREKALLAFSTSFRQAAVLADQDLPVWDRLRPIAEKVGLQGRWTLPGLVVGLPRRDLAEFGPTHWGDQAPVETPLLATYRGRPVLAQFFIGVHCGFCLEQLQKLAHQHPAFEELGVQVVGISPDSEEKLRVFEIGWEPVKLPFPLLSDPGQTVFRQFRIHDDLEGEAMHGTVLLDGNGKILWTFSGHEPFNSTDLLLSELRRVGPQ